LSKNISFKQLISSIFPGGSITGAPKKKSIEIIEKIEKRERGFYCGSTILWGERSIKASINIRSGVFDLNTSKLYYQAGGGITLQSKVREEYSEMLAKVDSFTEYLK